MRKQHRGFGGRGVWELQEMRYGLEWKRRKDKESQNAGPCGERRV